MRLPPPVEPRDVILFAFMSSLLVTMLLVPAFSSGAPHSLGADFSIAPTLELPPLTTLSPTTLLSSPSSTKPSVVPRKQPGALPLVPGTARVSVYGSESGSHTANGEPFDGSSITFAHCGRFSGKKCIGAMPFGTLVNFCFRGRCVVARCNDRGPFVRGRTFDLSRATANAIGVSGVQTVSWHYA